MPYPNDRRKSEADSDDAVSPEFLAVLVACGGEVRAGDRPPMPEAERRQFGRRKSDVAQDPGSESARN